MAHILLERLFAWHLELKTAKNELLQNRSGNHIKNTLLLANLNRLAKSFRQES